MPAVEIHDLVVRYGDRTAVDGVSFAADAGEILVLLGPNGAGKTTTVETAEGYRRPTSGTVRVLGLDPARERRALTARVGVMLQRGGVYPSMGALEVVRLFAAFHPRAAAAADVLERVGMEPASWRTPWRRLSGGEQQRVSLALALAGRPEVAFLDEPSAGVDLAGRTQIRDVVSRLRDDGVTVVLTTHDLDDAERLADRVVVVNRGRVVADGPLDELRAAAGGSTVRFSAPPGLDVAALTTHLGADVDTDVAGEYVVRAPATPALVAALTAWLADRDVVVGDVRAGRGSLGDVLTSLVSSPGGPEDGGGAATAGRRRADRRRRETGR